MTASLYISCRKTGLTTETRNKNAIDWSIVKPRTGVQACQPYLIKGNLLRIVLDVLDLISSNAFKAHNFSLLSLLTYKSTCSEIIIVLFFPKHTSHDLHPLYVVVVLKKLEAKYANLYLVITHERLFNHE